MRAVQICAILLVIVVVTPALAQSTVTYQYDALARLSTAAYSSKAITYTYDPAGNRTQVATAAAPHFAATKTSSKKARKQRAKKR